jgi:8-oxo-dGTP pyrophosphatase MutT (NUDIX family)
VVIQAAGGVVTRPTPDGDREVLVVHRPRYGDWTLPKGKLEPGESHEGAAVREVEEETGVRCDLRAELPPQQYVDRHGRDKVVRYWEMTPLDVRAREPDEEVDEVRWVRADDASALLTYDADRRLLAGVMRERRGDPL